MLENSVLSLVLVIIITLVFDYVNGFNDTANAVATCVSTRAMSIRVAVLMAAVCNFVGAIVSTKVAMTIGKGIIDANSINQIVILSSVGSAVIWGMITWLFGMPSSSSHALIGGLIGGSLAHTGIKMLNMAGIKKIILSLLLSPLVGIVVSFFLMIFLLNILRNKHPSVLNKQFKKYQIVSAAVMAFSHGTADAQKSMGIIAMALASFGMLKSFSIPWTVIAACACAMALGTASGGLKIIKTVGNDFVKMKPIHGFCVQIASSIVILSASLFGLPTSTVHVLTSSVFGVGLSKRLSAINWKIAMNIVITWIFTIPCAGLLAYVIEKLLTVN